MSQRLSLLLVFVLLGFGTSCSSAQSRYATAETQRVVERMIEAHGGLDRWQSAPTMSFDNIFFNPFALQAEGQDPWWVSHEVIDQQTRNAYHDWPVNEATLTLRGNEVWTTGWNLGNMPRFQALFFYYFLNLPWLTQDDGVRLGAVGTRELPGFDKQYLTVLMTFTKKPAVGKTAEDSYLLIIDPDTYLLQGYEYSIGYGAMLDMFGVPEGQLFGPMLRIHDLFTTVDGLVIPIKMHTMPPDGSTTYGHHIILNPSFSEPFDDARLEKPAGAVVDTSSPERQ